MGRFDRTGRNHLAVMVASAAVLLICPVTAQPLVLATAARATTVPAGVALASTLPAGVARATNVPARPGKVLVVVLENHGAGSALRQMPYLAAQSRGYARASSYYAIRHPSLPNYLVLAGGSTFGVTDDRLPAYHRLGGSSVFGQVIARGHTARTYAEGMTTNCQRTNTGRYVARHNPWTYFASAAERSRCLKYDVPAGSRTGGALHRDVTAGRLPTFSMLIPDLCHDAHDCRLATADSWLKAWLVQIKAGPDFRAGRLAVVVTFDEDEHASGNQVLTVVIHPARRGVLVTRRLTHYSLSATPSRQVGAAPLRGAAGTPSFLAAFGLR
jgi:acid phosphatase